MVCDVTDSTQVRTATTPDRRVRKTRRQLQRALIELIVEGPYSEVTIDMITERADLARATFYAHFADKGTLLESVADQLIEELTADLVPAAVAGGTVIQGEAVIALYQRAARDRHLYLALLGGAGDGRPLRRVIELLAAGIAEVFATRFQQDGTDLRVPMPLIAQAWVGSHLSLLMWWLETEAPYSPQQMALLQLRLDVHGVMWGLGLEPGQVQLDEQAITAAL
jgi:AcrR family transcriptional regulator